MATRTALGIAHDKTTSTTLATNSHGDPANFLVSLTKGECLIVGIGCNGVNPPDTVKWGGRDLKKVGQRIDSVNGIVTTVWILIEAFNTDSRDLVATWTTAPSAKAMTVSKLNFAHVRDEIARNLDAASSTPSVGPTAEHLRRDDFMFGYLVAEGGTPDTAPTVSTMLTGQRSGTAGPPPVTNVTVNEYYLQCTTSNGVTLSGTLADARNWCNVLIAFKVAAEYCVDYWRSPIEAGDVVRYGGTTHTVNSTIPERNVVDIGTIGKVNASECEVLS